MSQGAPHGAQVLGEFQALVESLRDDTGADRTTFRLDAAPLRTTVDTAVAESAGPDVPSIRDDSSLDQRRLETVAWLERHRRTLVQPHFGADPVPPQALIEVYGVQAQVLEPVEFAGEMVGWLSVHSLRTREWTDDDLAAVRRTRDRVQELVHGVLG